MNITLENIIAVTRKELPEFVVSSEDLSNIPGNEDSPYLFYGDFMRFVMRKVTAEDDILFLEKLLRFVNGLFLSETVSEEVKPYFSRGV